MIDNFLLVILLIIHIHSKDCSGIIQSGDQVSRCFIPKTNHQISFQQFSVPCFLTSSPFSQEISAKVPFQYYENLKLILKSEILNFTERNKQFSRKAEFILQQLEKYPPSQIQLLVQLEDIVRSNERIETFIRKYFPPFLYLFKFWQKMLDFEYDYKYKYLSTFEAYHELCRLYMTGKPFLIKGKELNANQTLITKVSTADENFDDTTHRCSNQIYNIMENWDQFRMKYEDPYPILSLLCLEFDNACNNRINFENDDNQKENIQLARNKLSEDVDYFVSHGLTQEYYNFLGINLKIEMKTYVTPKSGESKTLVIYLSQKEFKSFKEKLPDEKFNLFEIANIAFYALDALNYWRYGSLMKALAISYIPKNLIESVRSIFDPTHIPGWKDCIHKVNYFTSKFGINLEKNDEQNMNNIDYQKSQEKGRILLKKFLNDIPELDGSYLVRIEIPENDRYTISVIPFL